MVKHTKKEEPETVAWNWIGNVAITR